MTPREWDCWQCGSRFVTDAQGELVEYTSMPHWCRGCQMLLRILQESALWRRRARRLEVVPTPVRTQLDVVATTGCKATVATVVAPRRILRFDARKAAANDRDDEE